MGTIKKVDQTATQNPPAQSQAPVKKGKPQVRSQPSVVNRILLDAYPHFDRRMKLEQQVDIDRVVQEYWDDSPEFAREFLGSAVRFRSYSVNPKVQAKIKWPTLLSRVKRAILNLIPENTDPPPEYHLRHLDVSHRFAGGAIDTFTLGYSGIKDSHSAQVKFIRELVKERPRYKGFFCEFSHIPFPYKPEGPVEIEKDVIQQLRINPDRVGCKPHQRLVVMAIAENHWSDSPEFATAFLFAFPYLVPGDLRALSFAKRAIFNILPKDKNLSQATDPVSQGYVRWALARGEKAILKSGRTKDTFKGWNQFIQELIKQRPLFKDFFDQYSIK